MKHDIALSTRLALSELRHGWKHFIIFVACLTLGVAVMASVNTFSFMVKNALEREAKSLIGGDVEVSVRGVPATNEERKFLASYGTVSYVSTLRTMLYSGDENTLVELKAVDGAYPLIGRLEFNEPISRQEAFADNGIAVDSSLLSQLDLKLGDTVKLGNAIYTIHATLKTEPDRVVQIFSFGPRVMLSHNALAQSGLVNSLSLIEHRYRIVTTKGALANKVFEKQFKTALNKRFPDKSWQVNIGTDGNRTIQRFIDQLFSFLTLSGLATFLIAGIGIGSSVRAYLEKKSQTIAVLKTLGASRLTVFEIYVIVLGLLALVGGVTGILVARMIVAIALPFITSILPVLAQQTSINIPSLLLALWYGALISYLFSMPALLSALNVKPSLLFRSKSGILLFRADHILYLVAGGLTLLLLATLIVTAQDTTFILGAIAMLLLAFFLFWLCAAAVRRIAHSVKVEKSWLRLALGNLHRPGSTTTTVILAIGISLTVLITLTLTEANFQAHIKRIAEEEAPSLFMMDIQADQQKGLYALLQEYATDDRIMLYPMVRGRISAINGKAIRESDVDDDVRWAIRGDRGISYSPTLPKNAKLVQGKWWPEDYHGSPLISVDKRFIDGMNLAIGDSLTLNILGEDIVAKVSSARDINYTTFQMNFALMLSPGVIDNFPRTYLATVHLVNNHQNEVELVKKIAQAFPGVTIIRTAEIVETIQSIMFHIATALRITVILSLLAGLLVLTSALSATIEQRLYDTAILKVLGARQRDILRICTTEWMLLALVTSLIAAIIGTFSSWLITLRFRGQDFSLMPEVTLATIIACIVVIWLTGYLGNRRLFFLKPAGLLRNE